MDLSRVIILASSLLPALTFHGLNAALNYLPVPTRYTEESRRHKWRNVVCSAVHAVIAAMGGLASIYTNPELLQDHLNVYSSTVVIFAIISIGYFLYDFIDISMHSRLKESLPILSHHFMGGVFLTIGIFSGKLHGLTALSYLIELNGPFLHLRLVLLMCDVKKTDVIFKINAVINVSTYILFRLGIFIYCTLWLFKMRADVGMLLPLASVVITGLNITLFYRLISSDYLSSKARSRLKQEDDIMSS